MAVVLAPTGVCYCGAEMIGHAAWDNHSPVEMMRPVKSPPDDDLVPTIKVRAYVELDDLERVGRTLTMLVPRQGPDNLLAARRAVQQLFAELEPVLVRGLARAIERGQSGQFQGD